METFARVNELLCLRRNGRMARAVNRGRCQAMLVKGVA